MAKISLLVGAILGVVGIAAVVAVIRHFEASLPQVADLRGNYRPPQVTRILARDGTLLSEIFTERRTVVPIASVPPQVKLAVLAAEDAGFYEHEGLNYFGILRALIVNLRAGRTRQGGSTITQQVVKNLVLDPERSYRRKIREALLARKLEQTITKDEILELYLNHIYFGHGRYGIEEAARFYFGKSAKEVTLSEAALLAGLPAGPELYSPRHKMEAALSRRSFVLGQMLDKGFIDQRQHDAAMKEPAQLAQAVEAQGQLAPEVVEIVKRTLKEALGETTTGGFTIRTTIDPRLQALARKSIRDNLDAFDKRYKLLAPFAPPALTANKRKTRLPSERAFEGFPKFAEHKVLWGVVTAADDVSGLLDVRVGTVAGVVKLADYERYNPQHLPASQFAPEGTLLRVSLLAAPPSKELDSGEPKSPLPKVPLRLELGPEGALVALDVRTRQVLALVGSYESMSGALDRATQAHRQPGSSFKPIVYSYALETRHVTPATLLETDPATLGSYKPGNFDEGEGKEPMRLREALAHSINVAAVHVIEQVGPANVVPWAASLGISSKMGADLSLALGSYEVTPWEMAGAYATFAAGGTYEQPSLVTQIVRPDGTEVPLPKRPPPARVMSEAAAYLTTHLLTSVIDHGTGAAAKNLSRPVAGKTGTTNQSKDAWFVGYSPDVVCAVWTGYDDARPLGTREQGATAALPAWITFMKGAHEKAPPMDFPEPPGIVHLRIDPASGLLPYDEQEDAITEVFMAGTEPTEVAPAPAAGQDVDAGAEGEAGVLDGSAQAP